MCAGFGVAALAMPDLMARGSQGWGQVWHGQYVGGVVAMGEGTQQNVKREFFERDDKAADVSRADSRALWSLRGARASSYTATNKAGDPLRERTKLPVALNFAPSMGQLRILNSTPSVGQLRILHGSTPTPSTPHPPWINSASSTPHPPWVNSASSMGQLRTLNSAPSVDQLRILNSAPSVGQLRTLHGSTPHPPWVNSAPSMGQLRTLHGSIPHPQLRCFAKPVNDSVGQGCVRLEPTEPTTEAEPL
ncbi:hypothetical protein P4O66_005202 [Electrophorus voltai]|uniref:Uncharacterized protein n=1 Tax=Electrophorus voltai TaxID=2609070 RepID=A0AAD9E6C3_9TELE|nr:hypothetical protein P4O66_005202 [Electrophorus voltai]